MALVVNKKAGMRFAVVDSFEAGIELAGHEVKSLRNKQGSMSGSRIVVRGGEAFLLGMSIPAYQPENAPAGYDPEHPRRLLLKKKEIALLAEAESRKGLTTVPLEVYNKGRYIKAKVAIVRGKTDVDRREDIKRREANKEAERAMKRR